MKNQGRKIYQALIWCVCLSGFTRMSYAFPLAFDFSFYDPLTNNSVQGIISGLDDNATSAATSVFVTANSGGYGLGEYVGDPDLNFWTIVNGQLTFFDFLSFGVLNTAPDVTCCSLMMERELINFLTIPYAGLTEAPNIVSAESTLIVFEPHNPSDMPVPTTPALFGLGLAALGCNRRKRKQHI